MKKIVHIIILVLAVVSVAACKSSAKEEPEVIASQPVETDDITKEVFTDNYGDKIEVAINNTDNTAVIHLDGKSYELKKNKDLPDYTASNPEYQYSNIRGNITFLKRNVDMVLFHHKQEKKGATASKMASY
ncbi:MULTISPECIES: hypothetical protein [Chryseobacterium]|uniref:hypothetical protein n=1 Tax=Chryseobacterium TaxID=59732 RepID=UPI0015551738|nr:MULTISPECIES: hypothetical protein [unclassified Chryseobacterium]MDC8106815.1 hypothetical protein [Chryseobacterium sp. B21-037]MDQ1805907.1 hypothetical protein [Chryseobacterium sp. CKR4-1]WBV56015.1 hypothetical protein PFY10_17590 [Chryseobacterium daecheongense]